jgi:hypothetical protein
MQKFLPVLRSRRERRLAKQRSSSNRARGVLLSVGMVFSIVLAASILLGAFAYADVTRDLPSVEILPRLLNPPMGFCSSPRAFMTAQANRCFSLLLPLTQHSRVVIFPSMNKTHSMFLLI